MQPQLKPETTSVTVRNLCEFPVFVWAFEWDTAKDIPKPEPSEVPISPTEAKLLSLPSEGMIF